MRLYLILLLIIAIAPACKKSSDNTSCTSFEQALLKGDQTVILQQLQNMTRSLGKLPIEAGYQDSEAKLQKLVQSINNRCNIEAQLLCTMCIETLPEQSEIRLTYDTKTLVVDLYTEAGEFVQPAGVHE